MTSVRPLPAFTGALVALVANAVASGCAGGPDEFERFVERHSQVAVVRDGSPLTVLDLRRGESRELLPEGACGRFPTVTWSPSGSRLLCVGQTGEQETTAIVIDAETGEVANVIRHGAPISWWWCGARLLGTRYRLTERTARIEIRDDRGRLLETLDDVGMGPAPLAYPPDGEPLCAPSGDRVAYRDETFGGVAIVRLDDLGRDVTAQGAWPLVWAKGGNALVVARKYVEKEPFQPAEYEASLLDVASGVETRLPFLDNETQFWVAPDGDTVAFIPKERRADGLPSLAIGGLDSATWRPVPESVITFGSEYIPRGFVRFSPDGRTLYWISDAAAVFQYDLISEGGRAQPLGEWTSPIAFTPSPRLFVHQVVRETTLSLDLIRVDGEGQRTIARGTTSPLVVTFFSVDWRPSTR